MQIHRWLHYHIKLLLAASLLYTGVLFYVLHRRFRNRGLVLLYHRVMPDAERAHSFSSKAIVVSPITFDRHLRFLRRHFTVVGPEEFREWLTEGRQFPQPPCLITFDDGWKDNCTHARPVLRALNLPAVVFLPTAYIGTGNLFWQERLTRLLYRLGRQPALRKHPVVARYAVESLFSTQQARLADHAGVLAQRFKGRPSREVENVIDDVRSALDERDDAEDVDTYITWDDVLAMRADGIIFGSHAVSHRILTQIEPADVIQELVESKNVIEQHLGTPVHHFAYPNGNYNSEICETARQAGYQLSFTTVRGHVTRGDDPMTLRRINIHDGAHRHLPLFCASILGVL